MVTNDINEISTIRTPEAGDLSFIYSTWLRGLYYGNDWFQEIPKAIFMEHYHRVVELVLKKETTKVRVRCLKEDPTTILGYSVFDDHYQFIHWIYVKEAWRRFGIAKSLYPPDSKTTTHLTKQAKALKPKDLIFNPFF